MTKFIFGMAAAMLIASPDLVAAGGLGGHGKHKGLYTSGTYGVGGLSSSSLTTGSYGVGGLSSASLTTGSYGVGGLSSASLVGIGSYNTGAYGVGAYGGVGSPLPQIGHGAIGSPLPQVGHGIGHGLPAFPKIGHKIGHSKGFYQPQPKQVLVEQYATAEGPVVQNEVNSFNREATVAVTHRPVYHKTIYNHYTLHDRVNKDVVHHIGEKEVRKFDVAGKSVHGGSVSIQHGDKGHAAYRSIVGLPEPVSTPVLPDVPPVGSGIEYQAYNTLSGLSTGSYSTGTGTPAFASGISTSGAASYSQGNAATAPSFLGASYGPGTQIGQQRPLLQPQPLSQGPLGIGQGIQQTGAGLAGFPPEPQL